MSVKRGQPTRPAGLLAVAAGLWLVAAVSGSRAETLGDAWGAALASDHALLAARSRLAAASAELDAARGGRQPTVTAGGTLTRFETTPAFDFGAAGLPIVLPLVSGKSLASSQASVTLPLYTGGAIAAGVEAAGAVVDVRDLEARTAVQDVKLGVAQSYVAVLRAQSALAAAESSTASLASHARDVEDMFASGEVPRNDSLASAVSLADAEQRELKARNALELARSAYNRGLDRALTAPVALEDELPPVDPRLDSGSLEALVELALATRTEPGALAAAAESYEAQSAKTRAAMRPQLEVSGGYTFLENDVLNRDDFWTVGLSLRWNLFDGGRSRDSAEALSLRAAAVTEERVDLESGIELAVREAWLDLRETRARVDVTRGAVEQAEENLRVARDRYRFGEGTNTEVLDAETLRERSRSNFDDARYDAALARYRLARAVGVL